MNLQKVGKFIAKMRKKVGMTQSDLGEALGVSGKAVSKWERGLNAPDIQVLVELAKLLNVTATEILVGEKLDNDITTEEANEIAISSINTYNNYSKKKYTKIILVLVSIIVLIITAFSTTYFITNYNKCFVYKLSSADKKYHLEGLIASNQKENSIIITGIMADFFQEYNDEIDSYRVEFKINKLEMFSNNYKFNENNIQSALDNIDIIISNNSIIPKKIEKSLGNKDIKIYITFYSNSKEIDKIIIPVKIEKKFSNDKLFY